MDWTLKHKTTQGHEIHRQKYRGEIFAVLNLGSISAWRLEKHRKQKVKHIRGTTLSEEVATQKKELKVSGFLTW